MSQLDDYVSDVLSDSILVEPTDTSIQIMNMLQSSTEDLRDIRDMNYSPGEQDNNISMQMLINEANSAEKSTMEHYNKSPK